MKYGLSTNGIIHQVINNHYKCNGAVGIKLQVKNTRLRYPLCANCFGNKKYGTR